MAEDPPVDTSFVQIQRQREAARADLQQLTDRVSQDLHTSLRRIHAYAHIIAGWGVAPEQGNAQFHVFGGLHPAHEFDGLGMGEVPCRRIVERPTRHRHAAEVNADCRVMLTLPLA